MKAEDDIVIPSFSNATIIKKYENIRHRSRKYIIGHILHLFTKNVEIRSFS